MGVMYGVNPTWGAQTNEGRTHIATKGVVQSGLVLNLDAGVLSSYPGSGNTWTDLSGNGNTGTLQNTPTYNSANGGFLSFDGSNQRVISSLPTLTSHTTSIWFRTFNTAGSEKQILDSNGIFGISIVSNKFHSYTGVSNFSNQTVVNNVWYNWVVTCTNSPSNSLKFTINGVVDGDFSSYYQITGPTISIAYSIGTNGRYLNADISSFTVYNRVLTATEIQQNYLATKSRYFS
jgi:hypothetical protein